MLFEAVLMNINSMFFSRRLYDISIMHKQCITCLTYKSTCKVNPCFPHTFSILVINRSLQANWEYYKVDWLSMVRTSCKNIYQRANHDLKFIWCTSHNVFQVFIIAFYILRASRCMFVLLGYLIPHRYLLSLS